MPVIHRSMHTSQCFCLLVARFE